MQDIERLFTNAGGRFVSPIAQLAQKLQQVKAFVFDWDGVFNNASKLGGGSSSFNEVDSMGTNLLRYAYFSKSGHLPLSAVISGERNETAFYFCKREYFHYSFFKTPHKTDALTFICEQHKLLPHEVAYVFDDVLDLSIASVCGVRILVGRSGSPLFTDHCIKGGLVDYITGAKGGDYAVREACELLIGLYGNYDEVISNRTHYAEHYRNYLSQRRAVATQFYTVENHLVQQIDLDGKP